MDKSDKAGKEGKIYGSADKEQPWTRGGRGNGPHLMERLHLKNCGLQRGADVKNSKKP